MEQAVRTNAPNEPALCHEDVLELFHGDALLIHNVLGRATGEQAGITFVKDDKV